MKRAVVLLSGGMDSATVLHMALNKGYEADCLIFDYGQRHGKEIGQAVKIAKSAGCNYKIIKLPFSWGGSRLLNKKARLPKQDVKNIGKGIPPTYVPARNTVFLSVAASMAEATGADAIFIGANAVDYSGYPDCRPGYFKAFKTLLKEGTRRGVSGRSIKIITPLIGKTKSEIIKIGSRLKVPYHLTWSCYAGGKVACMECDSCRLRKKGFDESGIKDPLAVSL
ncbi:MAG: 7-cyano-7-deazaguanine synthase QueC [Candidatus Omnitrophota bacterium]|nr:7-cyano-7-deazaguanine synthase QueC [Candidatus Omnitrophota bacterium]